LCVYWSAATAGGIAPGQAGVNAEEVAPAGEFVEGTLLIALADVALDVSPGTNEVVIVVCLMVDADAEAVVVEVLHAPVDVSVLEDGLAEGRAQVGGNGCQFVIAGVGGQFVGIVLEVEEWVDIAFLGVIALGVKAINLLGGEVDGLLLRRVEGDEAVGQSARDIDNAVQFAGAQQLKVAIKE
jgi:hypothetical protein